MRFKESFSHLRRWMDGWPSSVFYCILAFAVLTSAVAAPFAYLVYGDGFAINGALLGAAGGSVMGLICGLVDYFLGD